MNNDNNKNNVTTTLINSMMSTWSSRVCVCIGASYVCVYIYIYIYIVCYHNCTCLCCCTSCLCVCVTIVVSACCCLWAVFCLIACVVYMLFISVRFLTAPRDGTRKTLGCLFHGFLGGCGCVLWISTEFRRCSQCRKTILNKNNSG